MRLLTAHLTRLGLTGVIGDATASVTTADFRTERLAHGNDGAARIAEFEVLKVRPRGRGGGGRWEGGRSQRAPAARAGGGAVSSISRPASPLLIPAGHAQVARATTAQDRHLRDARDGARHRDLRHHYGAAARRRRERRTELGRPAALHGRVPRRLGPHVHLAAARRAARRHRRRVPQLGQRDCGRERRADAPWGPHGPACSAGGSGGCRPCCSVP